MFFFSCVFFSLLLVERLTSHVCLVHPQQRGNFSIDLPGDPSCYHKLGPCGINDMNGERTIIQANKPYEVLFQQNLNHYYTKNPGSLDVSFAIGQFPNESDFSVLASFNDYNPMNQITQTNFSVNITMPNIECAECVLRVRYISNNLDESNHGSIFYQCADIQLTSPSENENQNVNENDILHISNVNNNNSVHDCCTPSQFSTSFKHSIPATHYTAEGIAYYDQLIQQMRVDVVIGNGTGITIYDGKFSMIMNFTNGLQYYMNMNNKTCSPYGLDFWNDWCFGNTYNESENFLKYNTTCDNGMGRCNQWVNGGFLFETVFNTQSTEGCLPASITRKSGESVIYFNQKVGPVPPNIFVPNPICLEEMKVKPM